MSILTLFMFVTAVYMIIPFPTILIKTYNCQTLILAIVVGLKSYLLNFLV